MRTAYSVRRFFFRISMFELHFQVENITRSGIFWHNCAVRLTLYIGQGVLFGIILRDSVRDTVTSQVPPPGNSDSLKL